MLPPFRNRKRLAGGNLQIMNKALSLFAETELPSIARMAELVDALVSNTSGAIRAGSIPAPGTKRTEIQSSILFAEPLAEPNESGTQNLSGLQPDTEDRSANDFQRFVISFYTSLSEKRDYSNPYRIM